MHYSKAIQIKSLKGFLCIKSVLTENFSSSDVRKSEYKSKYTQKGEKSSALKKSERLKYITARIGGGFPRFRQALP